MELNEKLWEKVARSYQEECANLKQRGRDICAGLLSKYYKFTFYLCKEVEERGCILTIELDKPTECEIESIWLDRETNKIMAEVSPIDISEADYVGEFETCLDDEKNIDWSYLISCIIGID